MGPKSFFCLSHAAKSDEGTSRVFKIPFVYFNMLPLGKSLITDENSMLKVKVPTNITAKTQFFWSKVAPFE